MVLKLLSKKMLGIIIVFTLTLPLFSTLVVSLVYENAYQDINGVWWEEEYLAYDIVVNVNMHLNIENSYYSRDQDENWFTCPTTKYTGTISGIPLHFATIEDNYWTNVDEYNSYLYHVTDIDYDIWEDISPYEALIYMYCTRNMTVSVTPFVWFDSGGDQQTEIMSGGESGYVSNAIGYISWFPVLIEVSSVLATFSNARLGFYVTSYGYLGEQLQIDDTFGLGVRFLSHVIDTGDIVWNECKTSGFLLIGIGIFEIMIGVAATPLIKFRR